MRLSVALLWDYSLILPSQETYSEETKAMLPHSPGDFITNVEQFFSITIIFKSRSLSVFTVAWPKEIVLQSKLCGPLLLSSDFLLWTGHKGISLPLSAFLAGNDLLNPFIKHWSDIPLRQSGAFRVQFGASQFLFLCEPQHHIVAFWTQTQGSLRFCFFFSFEFIPSLFIPIVSNNPSCLVGFCVAKALFVYLPQYSKSNQSKFSILPYPNYHKQHKKSFLEFTKFCKGSSHLFCSCLYNRWVVVIIIDIFELRKWNCEINS